MAGNEDNADVFAIPDLWQSSKWLNQIAQTDDASPPFFATGLKGMLSRLAASPFMMLSLGLKIALILACCSLRRSQPNNMASLSFRISTPPRSLNQKPTKLPTTQIQPQRVH